MEVDTTWNCNLWKPKRRRRRGNNNENSRGTLRPKRTKRDAKNIELKPNLQNSFLKQCSSQKYLNLLERLYSERFRKALYQRMWCTASTETPRVRPQRRKFVVIVMIDPYFYFKDLSSCVHILRQLAYNLSAGASTCWFNFTSTHQPKQWLQNPLRSHV